MEETTEGGNPCSWADHNDGFAGVGWEFKVAVAGVCWDMDSIVFISRTLNSIGDSMGMRMLFAVLFGFESEEVVRGDTVKDFFAVSRGTSFDNGGDMRRVGVDFAA